MGIDARKPVIGGGGGGGVTIEQQRRRPASLTSAFVIRSLESIISRLATNKISIFLLVSVAQETGLPESRFVGNPENRFCRIEVHMYFRFPVRFHKGLDARKPVFGIPKSSYPNQPAKLPRLSRKLIFCKKQVKVRYISISE